MEESPQNNAPTPDTLPANAAPIPQTPTPVTQQSRIMAALSRVLPRNPHDPSILSAERAPAAEALAAANYTEPRPGPMPPERLPDIPQTAANALPDVPALHTYKGDIASTIEERNLSLASIAQAETRKLAQETPSTPEGRMRRNLVRIIELALGLAFVIAAAGVLGWTYLRLRPLPPSVSATAPYIFVDQNATFTDPADTSRAAFMSALQTAIQPPLSTGLVEEFALMAASTTPGVAAAPMTTQDFFALVAPDAPDALVRNLYPQFLFGIHGANGNQPFLIFKTDSYEDAFAGMLAWEGTMQDDLAPLFPKPSAAPMPEAIASTTATSTAPIATSSVVLPTQPEVIQDSFTDAVLDNQDARVIRDASGNIVLLWSFADRQTLVITTDAATLTELISRLQKAPTITIPNQ